MSTRSTQFRPVGNYLQGLNYDPRQAIAGLEQVIGRLPDQHKYDYTGNQARTFGDLTELLKERAPRVIKTQITGLLEKSYVSPYTTFLLPIRQFGEFEGDTITWTEMHFNPGFADQVAVLGLGRLFTHNKTRRGASAVRRGAAVKIEAGFFMTPEGREEWSLQLEQLATVIQETNEYDVLITLLQVPMAQEIHAQEMNGPYNHMFYGARPDMSFADRLELMKDMFSIVNKTKDSRGFNGMVTNLRTIMERNGATPDAIVTPPYMVGHYYFTNSDLWDHMSAGPAVTQNRANATDIGGNGPFRKQTIQGLKIIDTHVYRPVKGARSSANDLLTVPVQIGEFYPMCSEMVYRDGKSYEKYRSSARDIEIFNEDQSRMVPVYFLDALKNSFRWGRKGNGEFDDELDEERHSQVQSDIFRNGGNTIKNWGDITKEFLPDEALERVAASVKGNLFTVEEWKNFAAAIRSSERDENNENDENNKNDDVIEVATAILDDVFGSVERDKIKDVLGEKETYTDSVGTSDAYVVGFTPADRSKIFTPSKNSAMKWVIAHFLNSRVSIDKITRIHEADVFVPLNVLLSRPWMTYYASSIIIMKAGRETGETLIGRQDFQMSSNTQTRELEASMIYHGKAIVRNSRNVMVAPHVFIQSYVGGNNTNWVTEENLEKINEDSGLVDSENSLVAMVIPYGTNVYKHNWIDYRGINPNVPETKFHESSEFYTSLFSVTEGELFNPIETFIDYEAQTYPMNSICWAGHINYGEGFSKHSLCQGHLGPSTYDQINSSRKEGQYAPIHSMHFNVTTQSTH
jgi:hypothetical protein